MVLRAVESPSPSSTQVGGARGVSEETAAVARRAARLAHSTEYAGRRPGRRAPEGAARSLRGPAGVDPLGGRVRRDDPGRRRRRDGAGGPRLGRRSGYRRGRGRRLVLGRLREVLAGHVRRADVLGLGGRGEAAGLGELPAGLHV